MERAPVSTHFQSASGSQKAMGADTVSFGLKLVYERLLL